jgi:hypothetical protein
MAFRPPEKKRKAFKTYYLMGYQLCQFIVNARRNHPSADNATIKKLAMDSLRMSLGLAILGRDTDRYSRFMDSMLDLPPAPLFAISAIK